MVDRLRNAYAALELRPDCSTMEVRRQFKRLVRRWHPDQFADDPHGRADAQHRLTTINLAYREIMDSRAEATGERARQTLSQEEIDGIVDAIGNEGPFDVLFAWLAWSWPLFLAAALSTPLTVSLGREIRGEGGSNDVWIQLGLCVLSLCLWLRQRYLGRD